MSSNNNLTAKNLSEIFFSRFFEDWNHLSASDFLEYLEPKIEQSITWKELYDRLLQNKKLKIKFGIDPTGPDVHLGHVLPIIVLSQFQRAGHQIDLIIGDFTAMIGDPSGRDAQRKALDEKTIENNFKTYLSQIGKYLNVKDIKSHKNSKWLSKKTIADSIKDLQKINLSEVMQREDFRNRIASGHSLTVAELLYSYFQGLDSVELESDIEIGGRDQFLNFAQARNLMEIYGQKPEVVLATPVLEGTSGDGRKMSKSYNNYIAVNASTEEKFGQIMSMPDNLIFKYFKAFADVKTRELSELETIVINNPLKTKKQLAQFLVSIETKDLKKGIEERENFEKKFSSKEYDKNIKEIKVDKNSTYFDFVIFSKVVSSKSEAMRLFEQGGVNMVSPSEKTLKKDDKVEEGIVKIGKKNFFKIAFD